ncbi:MAG: choice-of-anchor L domain-containing protein [Gelidibacter sp.]
MTPDNFYGNNGDVSGVYYQSAGDTISFTVTSDGVFSCQTEGYQPLDITVSCATCINPSATYAIVDDCDNGDQFLIDVNVTSLGSASSLTISNNIDTNTVSANAVGTYQIGPFPFSTDIIVTLSNDDDINCVINSSAFQLLACPPANDNPCNATVAVVNEDGTCDLTTPGTVLEATPSGIPAGTCFGDPNDDVWFQFTALHEEEIISINNISGGTNDLDFAIYEGTCDALTQIFCSPDIANVTPQLIVGNIYYIRVFSAGTADATSSFDLCISEAPGNVIVDQTTYTVEQLIQDILVNSPCAQVSNITYSTGTDYGQENGIGYFTSDGVGFPFQEGILLTSGDANLASGPNTNAMSVGTNSWLGDADLNATVGITSNNASIIEFDFVPLAEEISFDFLMASEEYNGSTGGSFECTYSDAFAFLLTDPDGVTTNLAVLPETTTPILVTNIHPENPSCPAINEQYFGGYTPQNLPSTSFDGRTKVFTAQSAVTVGATYHIKLVIADATDSALDSGVFLKAGSFDLGEANLGDDITIAAGTAVCGGEEVILNTNVPNINHIWYYDGIEIPGETSSTLVATEPGEYTVQIVFSSACFISDSIIVEFLPNPEAHTPPDLIGCDTSLSTAEFNLTDNDSAILGDQNPDDFTVTYHLSEQDAIDNINPLVSPYTNISNPQVVYARVTDNATSCHAITNFSLTVNDVPVTTFTTDFDYEVCPNATVPIEISATPNNYSTSEVTINWYQNGVLISGQNSLNLPVLTAGLYEIEVIFNNSGCSSITGQEVIELAQCIIPQGISPNGDGYNDNFDLSSFGVTKIEIFNRNGRLVYSKTNYVDEWHGQTNSGDNLPVGTYFYTMTYDGGKQKSAWVYINK